MAFKFVEADQFGNQIKSTDQVLNSSLTSFYAGVDIGISNSYELSFTGPYSALTNGMILYWIPSNTNTGNSTLAILVNGSPVGGVVPILNQNGSQLGAGQIVSGGVTVVFYYNGNWLLTSSTGTLATNGLFTGILNGTTGGGGSTSAINCSYIVNGSFAEVFLGFGSVTIGTGGTLFMSGLPTVLQPATQVQTIFIPIVSGGGLVFPCMAQISPGSANIVFFSNFPSQTWSGSATLGAHVGISNFGQNVFWGLT